MATAPFSLPVLPPDAVTRLTPTDISQFVRLEQCERFLRLRLAERAGQEFMAEYGVGGAPLHRVGGGRGWFRTPAALDCEGDTSGSAPMTVAEVIAQIARRDAKRSFRPTSGNSSSPLRSRY